MYKELHNEKVTVLVSTHGDTVLEYNGTLTAENEYSITLSNVDIGTMLLNIQKGIFGGNVTMYKDGVDKVIINKKYIISCYR